MPKKLRLKSMKNLLEEQQLIQILHQTIKKIMMIHGVGAAVSV